MLLNSLKYFGTAPQTHHALSNKNLGYVVELHLRKSAVRRLAKYAMEAFRICQA